MAIGARSLRRRRENSMASTRSTSGLFAKAATSQQTPAPSSTTTPLGTIPVLRRRRSRNSGSRLESMNRGMSCSGSG